MKVKEKIFPCLNCGSDTGCPNKLICDKCKTLTRRGSRVIPKPFAVRRIHRRGKASRGVLRRPADRG